MQLIKIALYKLASPFMFLRGYASATMCCQAEEVRLKPMITSTNTVKHRIVNGLSAQLREMLAEMFLRRASAPGPATEHAIQYLLSVAKAERRQRQGCEATVVAGADLFYQKQYRQFLNPTMGAFAMTATQALLGSGGKLQGKAWRRYRRTHAAVTVQVGEIMPIMVLNDQTVALPLLLPVLESEPTCIWPLGTQAMPDAYRRMMEGEEVRCYSHGVHASERSADGSLISVLVAIRQSRKLAVLALHPHDPDAMGLHITLFDVGFLEPQQVKNEYGLPHKQLTMHIDTAKQLRRRLVYCVGGTEEVFTQCSQNLFAKQSPPAQQPRRALAPNVWYPALPLHRLLSKQFETIQVTVSASGLPGASPRNGDQGKAVFVAYRDDKPLLLIPYHPGNAVHGHAAKLWCNPYGTLVISDDHCALTRVMIYGPSQVISHGQVVSDFPEIAAEVAAQTQKHGMPVADPQYWFLQEVAELIQEREPLPANVLFPSRAPCTISAGGKALHNKKPAYFNADSLQAYDQDLHHRRESHGRYRDPDGEAFRHWNESLTAALTARRGHLASVMGNGGSDS
jgi:hypothetical protein